MNTRELIHLLIDAVACMAGRDEKQAIVLWLLEDRLGLPKSEILSGTEVAATFADFAPQIQRLNEGEPLQYILGYAEFRGRRFHVNPSVLIPRPETELLIDVVIDALGTFTSPRIWDIGTGSGCIALTLALELSKAQVIGSDISAEALEVARTNAVHLGVSMEFLRHDILQEGPIQKQLDVIVSNPPYVQRSEKSAMAASVTRYEPWQALFVPDDDPLLFHQVIAAKAAVALKAGGFLIMEINEALGVQSAAALVSSGFHDVMIRKDLDGKDRFVSGIR